MPLPERGDWWRLLAEPYRPKEETNKHREHHFIGSADAGLIEIKHAQGGECHPAGTGDGGHGRGLMQIDDRAHPDFISTGKWTDPQENISYAMVVLNQSHRYLRQKTDLSGDDLRAAAIAGYNCGPGNVRKSVEAGESWDARTTGRDYSEDVIARSAEFMEVFQEAPKVPAPPVAAEDTGAQFRVNTDGLNLRSRPDLSPTARIGVLKRGHLVTKLGEDADPKWWNVDTILRGIQLQGYVNHGYLIAAQDYVAPPAHTGVVAVHLKENIAKAARNVFGWQAYPLGEPNRPGRPGTIAATKVRELTKIIAWLDVEDSARYQPNSRATYCNIYAYDYCYLAGVYLPRVWWTPNAVTLLNAGEQVSVEYARTVTEKNVNSIFNWLEEFGEYFGWKPMDSSDLTALQKAANEGDVVVICAQRKDLNRAGHIAVVAPETDEEKALWRGGEVSQPLTSQAGANNYNYRQTSAWWKMDQFRDYAFWQHD